MDQEFFSRLALTVSMLEQSMPSKELQFRFQIFFSTARFWYWFMHSRKSRLRSTFQRWILAKLSELALKEYEGSENMMKIAPNMKE
jgi:hypothetical protein